MMNELRVGDLISAHGEKVAGKQPIRLGNHEIELPVFLVNGTRPGPTLAITAGIHGAEYASIAAALKFGQMIKPETLKGKLIVIPVANVPAFRARSIYVSPLDGLNLNRVFPGKENGMPTEQMAHWLVQNVFKQIDFYVDMHGGDLIEKLLPFSTYYLSNDKTVAQKSLELAKAFGLNYIVGNESKEWSASAASLMGIPSTIVEAGGQGIWSQESVDIHIEGLERLLLHLGMSEGPTKPPVQVHILDRLVWSRSEQDGFYYPLVDVGEQVKQGQYIGAIKDYEGSVVQPLIAPSDGIILFLVSALAIGKGDPLIGIGASL